MLKLFYKRLKDQTGLAFIPVLIVASLVITGLGLWSVGTEAKKTIDKKEPLYKYGQENNTEDAEAYQEQINKAMVMAAVDGGKVAVGAVAGVHDTYLVTTALDAAGAFDTEKRKTTKLDKLEPPPASQKELNRLMQLTEDEIDRLVMQWEEDEIDRLLEETDAEDLSGLSDEEIDRLLEETGNLDYGIEKMVKKKVELNSDPETTQQEKKTFVDETIKNIQKAEDNDNKVDLNSWVKTILKGAEKLADQKLIDLRKELARNQLSSDYNTGIIEKYEEYQAKGQGISDTSELAEAKRRVAGLYDESIIIEAKIKELEDAKQISPETTVAETTPETTKITTQPTETTPETKTQPTETIQETTSDTQEEIITLYGRVRDGLNTKLTIIINFSTGEVTGSVKGDTGLSGNIKGKIILPDNKINMTATGIWSNGELEFSYDLTGVYYPEKNSASGMTSSEYGSVPWDASK